MGMAAIRSDRPCGHVCESFLPIRDHGTNTHLSFSVLTQWKDRAFTSFLRQFFFASIAFATRLYNMESPLFFHLVKENWKWLENSKKNDD
jgi:hypothetical protein